MRIPNVIQTLLRRMAPKRFYCEDALLTAHNHDFINDPAFINAYERGLKAGGETHHNRWRVHVMLWVARNCLKLTGDFVELGVNYGFMSSAVLEALHPYFGARKFWLVDSFEGRDEEQVTKAEVSTQYDKALKSGFYNSSVEQCRKNFKQWGNVEVIKGWIPECLNQVYAEKIAFMHIDLNCGAPEIAAFEYFYPSFEKGAMILLDDYAFAGHEVTYQAWQKLSYIFNLNILSLPTGQGLIQL